MKKIVFCFFYFYCLIAKGQVQFFYFDKYPYADTVNVKQMFQATRKLEDEIMSKGQKIGRLDVLEIGNDVFALARGRLDVFQWMNGEWVNLYKGIFHGHNFHSKNFTRNNELYSFGGYGYWSRHGRLLSFSKEKGDWELIECTRDLNYNIAYSVDKGLRLVGVNNIEIDMDNQTLIPYEQQEQIEQIKYASHFMDIEFENYLFIPSISPLAAVDKRTHQFYFLDDKSFTNYYSANPVRGIFHIRKDSVDIYKEDFVLDKKICFETELKKFYKVKPASIFFKNAWWSILLLLSLLIMFFVVIWRFYARNKIRKSHELYEIVKRLKELKEVTISMSDLDAILNLKQIGNPDTIKFKRAQKIQEINRMYQYSNNKILIERIKDNTDKRKYIYLINK